MPSIAKLYSDFGFVISTLSLNLVKQKQKVRSFRCCILSVIEQIDFSIGINIFDTCKCTAG